MFIKVKMENAIKEMFTKKDDDDCPLTNMVLVELVLQEQKEKVNVKVLQAIVDSLVLYKAGKHKIVENYNLLDEPKYQEIPMTEEPEER